MTRGSNLGMCGSTPYSPLHSFRYIMKIISDFLTKEYQDNIKTSALYCPWFYQDNTCDFSYIPNYPKKIDGVEETPFFVNMMVDDFKVQSEYFKYFRPVIGALEIHTGRKYLDRLFRMKANLYTKQPNYKGRYHTPHVDVYDEKTDTLGEGEIFLYYVDDSDGDTFFFNERFPSSTVSIRDKIGPAKGKGVLFDLQTLHASSPPRQHEHRITLNFVFRK